MGDNVLKTITILLLYTHLSYGFPVEEFRFSSSKIVDLSYPFSATTVYWPPNGEAFRRNGSEFVLNGTFIRDGHFSAGEHGGTHIDSPAHFSRNGSDIADLRIDQLAGPLVVLNISGQAQTNPDYEVGYQDISVWEQLYGIIPAGAFVFLFSNYGERYPDRNKLFNAEDPITIHDMHFPGFHPGTTKFLIEKRNIRGVGTDTPSVDSGGGIRGSFGTHVALAAANLIGVEFTANLDQVPAAGAHVIISPMKIQSGSGAPSQIWAILP